MKKYILIGIPCLIAIIVASIYSLGSKNTIQYKTAKIDKGAISKYVTATGTINPVRTVLIGSQVTGLISKLYADFNSVVKVGQVVAQIDPVPFEHQIKKAEAALAQFVTASGGNPGAITPAQLAAFGDNVKAQILQKSQSAVPTPVLREKLINAINKTLPSTKMKLRGLKERFVGSFSKENGE